MRGLHSSLHHSLQDLQRGLALQLRVGSESAGLHDGIVIELLRREGQSDIRLVHSRSEICAIKKQLGAPESGTSRGFVCLTQLKPRLAMVVAMPSILRLSSPLTTWPSMWAPYQLTQANFTRDPVLKYFQCQNIFIIEIFSPVHHHHPPSYRGRGQGELLGPTIAHLYPDWSTRCLRIK